MTRHEMDEEHGKELDQLEAGQTNPAPEPAMIKRRMAVFTPVAVVFVVVGFMAVYQFTTSEKTAITTLPVNEIGQVFVPQTPTPLPPTPTPLPPKPTATTDTTGAAKPASTWDGGIGAIFDANCTACHGTVAGLSLQTYANAMKGGTSGPAITAGSPDQSLVINKTKDGNHSGKFSADELQLITAWIKAGALEK